MATGNITERKRENGEIRYEITVEGERDLLTGKRQRVYKTIKGTKKRGKCFNEEDDSGYGERSSDKKKRKKDFRMAR